MSRKQTCAAKVTNRKSQKFGQPCSRWAVKGSDYCAVHGGTTKLGLADAASLRNRCHAKNRRGEQCRQPAIKGGVVCRAHGGASPQVKRKARERFNDLIDPMINIATRLTDDALAGRMSHSDQMRLIAFIADRTGFQPGVTVEHEVKPFELTMSRIIKEIPAELAIEAEQSGDVVDAELVEDEGSEEVTVRLAPVTHLDRRIGSANPPNRDR